MTLGEQVAKALKATTLLVFWFYAQPTAGLAPHDVRFNNVILVHKAVSDEQLKGGAMHICVYGMVRV